MDNVYIGWNSKDFYPESSVLNEILLYAHQNRIPEIHNSTTTELETELANLQDVPNLQELQNLTVPLNIDKRCNLCSIVNLCIRHDTEKIWLYDYSLLCYKANVAPRTPLSVLIITTEFINLIKKNFKKIIFDSIFFDEIVTIFDFHIHFFINRCFSNSHEDLMLNENITLNHMSVMKSMLMKESTLPNIKLKKYLFKKSKINTNKKSGIEILEKQNIYTSTRFTYFIFYMWSGTNVFTHIPMTNLAIKKHQRLEKIYSHKSIEKTFGPILLSSIPVSITKNNTTTVCLLCELMASSKQDFDLLQYIYKRIVNYCQNNLKMIDRVQFTLAEILEKAQVSKYLKPCSDYSDIVSQPSFSFKNSEYILDTHSYLILKQVGTTGLYKHLFCDPLCLANIKTINPNILFTTTESMILTDFKLTICYRNEYLTTVEKSTWLAIQIFKAFQLTKQTSKNKTLFNDFLKEFTQILITKEFNIVDPLFTIEYYV